MRVLITGATGYLGTAMLEAVPTGVEAVGIGHTRGSRSVDITDATAVAGLIETNSPDVIVHLAAVSEVARAGADPSAALAVNAEGARVVAAAAAGRHIRLVALSSDVVFDGASAPFSEDSKPNPINNYGKSKLAGEEAVRAEHPEALIVRTSVLVGRDRADRNPFSAFVLERAAAGIEITLYENERRNFYPVTHAARTLWECTMGDLRGLLHIGAANSSSRFDFGRHLIEAAGFDPSLAVPATGPADRPSDLTLDVGLATRLLATPMPSPSEVVAEVLADAERGGVGT